MGVRRRENGTFRKSVIGLSEGLELDFYNFFNFYNYFNILYVFFYFLKVLFFIIS